MRDSLGVAASQYVARGMLIARGVVSAAALGPAGFGGWNALNLILDYGAYASAGTLQGLDLRLPAAADRDDRAAEHTLLAGAWAVVLVGGAAFAALVAVLVTTGHAGALGGLGALPIALMTAAALLQLAIQYHASALRARGRFHAVSAGTGVQALVGGGLGIALVWRFGVTGMAWGWVVGTLAALAGMRNAARANAGPGAVPLVPGAPAAGFALARAGFPIFAFFATSLVVRSVDRLALLRAGDTRGLGQYSLGLMAAGLVLYLPEAVAYVLFPRMASAAGGARDAERMRLDVRRAQRAITVVLPLVVALGMVWAGPVVVRVLPAYREGIGVLRLLAVGALLLSASTLPGYFLLGTGHSMRLLRFGIAAAVFSATLVFSVAARDPRPASIAVAATAAYGVFALGMVVLAARELCTRTGERLGFVVASFAPGVWVAAVTLAACAIGPPDSVAAAGMRTLAVALLYAPVLWGLGRGLGLGALARGRFATRPAAG